PAEGVTEVDVDTPVQITFSAPIQLAGQFVNATVLLRSGTGGGLVKNLTLSADGKTVTLPVQLEAGQSYTLTVVSAVSSTQQALTEPVTVTFSTTGAQLVALGTIRGKIDLAALPVPAAGKQADDPLEILFGEVLAVDATTGEQVGQGVVETDGTFEFRVPEGTYRLFAKIETNKGPTSGRLDDVSVTAEQTTDVETFTVEPPAALTTTTTEPVSIVTDTGADGPVFVDLDSAKENQKLTSKFAAPGDIVEVAVYIEGVKDLLGYEVQMQFDSTAVALLEVLDDGTEEVNLVKVSGGFVVGFVTPRLNTVTQTVAILGPTPDQLGQGNGLLGIFKFLVNERFFGTTEFVATQVLLSGQGGTSDTVQAFARAKIEVEGLSKQVTVSSDRDTLDAEGATQATLTAKLFDLDGIAFSTDDTSSVTFEVIAGSGKVNGGATSTVTVVQGQATATVVAEAEGNLSIQVSSSGARPVVATLAVPAPAALGEGPVGPMALDLDITAGDQEQRQSTTTPKAGDIVDIDLVATSGASGLIGYQATVTFSGTQLEFSSFAATGLFDGALPISTPGEGVIRVSVAFIGATATTSESGSIGKLSFKVKDGFSGATRVSLISGQFATSATSQTKLTIGSGGATVLIGSADAAPAALTPDFDGDGQVGFPDFLLFAAAFGSETGDTAYSARLDLDQSGDIGFPDFLQFAAAFGKAVSELGKPSLAKPVGYLPGLNQGAGLSLVPLKSGSIDETVVAVRVSDAVALQGYDLRMTFDDAALELVGVNGVSGSLFGDAVLQASPAAGEVILADVLGSDAAVVGEGELVRLTFRVLDPTVPGRVDIAEALVSDNAGRINRLIGAYLETVRALPEDYALSQNFPNPFNPETVVPFALPKAGEIRMVVYNILGQEVAVLMDGQQGAGFHRVVWDGKDLLGRPVSSGIYFVRMSTEGFSDVRKMLLLK
ncbi:MAG: cohesin domain-containing protein, partial [bacterium]|nr:cohesin domain-containing protein [bacterium]